MSASSVPADTDLPALLRRWMQRHSEHDAASLSATPPDIEGLRSHPQALLGALCVGGSRFAAWLAGQLDPDADDEARVGAVLMALMTAIEPPPDATVDHEHKVADALIQTLGLQASPTTLIDLLRIEFLIRLGPPAELPEAVLGAMRLQRWDLALEGVERVRALTGSRTPRETFGLAAICLHHLGRFADAERWIEDGLGPDRQRLAVPPAFTEKALRARWGHAKRPVVSIVCTTYNHERYIAKALQGFLSQDCPYPFEILIHDDASTDRTQDVIREWHARYPHIIKPILQTENQLSRGVRPLELLLARAAGDYVATCEGDDYWIAPGKLRQQVGFLMQHPDVSCSAHNYYLFVEASLTVRPWSTIGRDFFVSPRQMMASQMLLWLPTLVFRKTFTKLPPERALAAFGDQFLVSYLGTLGRCAYFETLNGAVRRENEFSSWTPLPAREKERRRVRTWTAMQRMHERLGNQQAVDDLITKIKASTLDAETKAEIAASCPPLSIAQPALA